MTDMAIKISEENHEFFMRRCLQLAQNGLGNTYPNPLVGCVIVHQGKIIGEGWHKKAGEPHAEVNAIHSVKNKSLLPESTLYVNLEPCSHFGKTPPCAKLLIDSGIKKVIVGNIDPFEKVSGKGIAWLQQAGCQVITGVLEDECWQLNKRFFSFHTKKRPYVILKWAETQNGFLAPLNQKKGMPVWISEKTSRQLVHKWRSEEMAILVGKNTIVTDNPKLTTRFWSGKNPTRIVIDKNLNIEKTSEIYNSEASTIIVNKIKSEKIENISFENPFSFEKMPYSICEMLFQNGIQSVIVEGGASVLQQFIESNLWDEARVFIGNNFFEKGIKAPEIFGLIQKKEKINNDILVYFRNEIQ